MAIKITDKDQNKVLQLLLEELKVIKNQLDKLLLVIPKESLKEYKNSSQIKKAYLKALKVFPPK